MAQTISNSPQRTTYQSIVASWLSMKTWVKVWLFALNAIFLAGAIFWPAAEVQWVLLAYVASGPLLALGMIAQKGLTRLLGLAHIVPWTPLAAYLGMRLFTDVLGPSLTFANNPGYYLYLVSLFVSVVICLSLDAYDIARWAKGETFVLGSDEAVSRGASFPAPIRLPCEPMRA